MAYIRSGRRDYSEAYRPGFQPRNKTLSFTVSTTEGEEIDAAATAAGVTRSAWITKKVVEAAKAATAMREAAKPAGKGTTAKKAAKTSAAVTKRQIKIATEAIGKPPRA